MTKERKFVVAITTVLLFLLNVNIISLAETSLVEIAEPSLTTNVVQNESTNDCPVIIINNPPKTVIETQSDVMYLKAGEMLYKKDSTGNMNPQSALTKDSDVFVVSTEGEWSVVDLGFGKYYVKTESLVDYDTMQEMLSVPYSEEVPLSKSEQEYLWNECNRLGIKYCFALGTIELESQFNPDAYHKNSNGSVDRGLCQVNSCWIKTLKKMNYISCSDDLYEPLTNLKCGMWKLNECVEVFGNSEKAYAYYNTGSKKINSNKASRAVMKNWESWKAILGDV